MGPPKGTLQRFVFRFCMGVCFLAFCYGIYLYGMHKNQKLYLQLKGQVNHLESELYLAIDKREDLLMQIQSQSDPAWIEMLIKKNLGMVPFGQSKVYFENQ